MDTKIKEIKGEYKAYLSKLHPGWSVNTIATHVSDAFYIWNNTILPGFWKVFLSEDSLLNARDAIRDYLQNDVRAVNYNERTAAYFRDLQMLKTFFDQEFGGIENRIGEEFWGEEILYDIARAFFEGNIAENQALDAMTSRVPYFSRASHKMTLGLFAYMMDGRKFTRRGNVEITMCFIRNIGRDYGPERLLNALTAVHDNIAYYYGKTGNKSNCIERLSNP